jgi:hypothetical protein
VYIVYAVEGNGKAALKPFGEDEERIRPKRLSARTSKGHGERTQFMNFLAMGTKLLPLMVMANTLKAFRRCYKSNE